MSPAHVQREAVQQFLELLTASLVDPLGLGQGGFLAPRSEQHRGVSQQRLRDLLGSQASHLFTPLASSPLFLLLEVW